MNENFSYPRVLLQTRQGPLDSFLDPYLALVREQGFLPESVRSQIRLLSDFSRWLHRNGYGVRDVVPETADQYLECRHRRRRPRSGDSATLDRLIDMLRNMAVIADPEPMVARTPYNDVLNEFKNHLSQERALSAAALKNYVPVARLLLTERFTGSQIDFSQLCATDITGFVLRHAQCSSRKSALLMTTALRSFLRFLYQSGTIVTDLAACVPTVPSWSLSDIPKHISPSQVQSILDHCDRKTAVGRRDYAILLLLARLGLRAGEVAFLKLEDINWEVGHITILGKGGRSALFPMHIEVGEAIADYLQYGRPRCSCRSVFVRRSAPRIGFATHTAISSIVRRALARAQVRSPHTGAHLFRHSLAKQMLKQGASLSEIGEILRHRYPHTTAIYAKVDLDALRTIALPWPGGA